jgi:uncharacterized protein
MDLNGRRQVRYRGRMKMTLSVGDGNQIKAYGPGRITINSETLTRSLIVSPSQLIRDWAPQRFADLTAAHFATLAALSPEVILIGTGATLRFPARELLTEIRLLNIGLEIMDTAAACRTYNVLMAEGREVAAGLLMISEPSPRSRHP